MKKKIIIIGIVVCVIAVGIFGGIKVKNYLPFFFDKNGLFQEDKDYTLTVSKQDFENEVADRLKENGIIVSTVRFLGYMHEEYPDFEWLNGTYEVNAKMTYKQLCEKLKNPDTRIEYVRFTVPEGKTVPEIADIVSELGYCTRDEFLQAADSYDYDYDFIKELQKRDDKLIGYRLEGYLFPATYEFRLDTINAKTIVDKMLKTFTEYVTTDVLKSASDKGLTINELISFASIIEGEANDKDSMVMCASVFWNRRNSKSLQQWQSCATKDYAEVLKALSDYSQEMFDAYDTYTCVGMPIGPVNNPGMDCINAVLNPADTDYYYFVTGKDGKFRYSKTYKEHINNCYASGVYK